MKTSFLLEDELENMGFNKIGNNVKISRLAQFYAPPTIEIGNNARIDDFCILSGKIKIGSYVHISAGTYIYGKKGVEINDYSGLSPRVTIFSETDNFSGDYLIGATIPDEYTNVTGNKVTIHEYCQIGAGSTILPGVKINQGVAVGAMSLVNKDLDEWQIYSGIPARSIRPRSKNLLGLVKKLELKTE